MAWGQRIILVIAGLFMLLFSFSSFQGYESDDALATVQFLIAIGLFYWAARRAK